MFLPKNLIYFAHSLLIYVSFCHPRCIFGSVQSEAEILTHQNADAPRFTTPPPGPSGGAQGEFTAPASISAASAMAAWTALTATSAYLAASTVSEAASARAVRNAKPKVVSIDKNNVTRTIENIDAAAKNAAITGMPFVYPGTNTSYSFHIKYDFIWRHGKKHFTLFRARHPPIRNQTI